MSTSSSGQLPGSFAEAQAIRRRNVSAAQAPLLDALAKQDGPTMLRMVNNSDAKFANELLLSKYVLAAVTIEFCCTLFNFTYGRIQDQILPESDAYQRLVRPVFTNIESIASYVVFLGWLLSIAEAVHYAKDWYNAGKIGSKWYALDIGFWLYVGWTFVAKKSALWRLLGGLRLFRVVGLFDAIESRAFVQIRKHESMVIADKQRAEEYAAQLEQMAVKLNRELETRKRLEELSRVYREEMEYFKEALLHAAQDFEALASQDTTTTQAYASASLAAEQQQQQQQREEEQAVSSSSSASARGRTDERAASGSDAATAMKNRRLSSSSASRLQELAQMVTDTQNVISREVSGAAASSSNSGSGKLDDATITASAGSGSGSGNGKAGSGRPPLPSASGSSAAPSSSNNNNTSGGGKKKNSKQPTRIVINEDGSAVQTN